MTDFALQRQEPAAGIPFATFDTLRGQRVHMGDIVVPADPNTAAHMWDMTLARLSVSGTGPFVQVYGYSTSVLPNPKTVDICKGGTFVTRFIGVQGSGVSPSYDNNEKQNKITASALAMFDTRTIATVSTNTITLDTKYDAAPSYGLVTGDLVRVYKRSDKSYLDTTITTVNADGITLVLGASAAAFAPGDMISLRAATPSFNLLATELWARTYHFFSDTVANAVTASATLSNQTRLEKGSTYEITWPFENSGGSPRSGGFDPAALPRLPGKATYSIKKYFDTPESVQDWNDQTKSASVVKSLSTSGYYEQISFNSLVTDKPIPTQKSKEVNYASQEMIVNHKQADSAAVTVTVAHSLVGF